MLSFRVSSLAISMDTRWTSSTAWASSRAQADPMAPVAPMTIALPSTLPLDANGTRPRRLAASAPAQSAADAL